MSVPVKITSHRLGAAAGALSILLYLVGAAWMGGEPAFDAPAGEVAAFFDENRTRVQVGAAFQAAWAPLFMWFLVTAGSLAASKSTGRAAALALACGGIFVTLFLADVGSVAVAALRPDNQVPEVVVSLRDFSWLAMAMAAPVASATIGALSGLALRSWVWPRWLGILGVVVACVYALRIGTLFTTSGPFAADGVLGLWLPVVAIAGWIVLASVLLTRSAEREGARSSYAS